VRNAIINDLNDVNGRTDIGPLFEQMVFAELTKTASLETLGPDVQFWRTKQGLEIDFVLDRASDLRAYECKWGNEAASFKIFLKLYPGAHTKIVRPDTFLTTTEEEL
jgi:predicted AAA+ superfamily ATPase